MAKTPSFRFVGVCNRQTTIVGTTNMVKSEKILMAEEAGKTRARLIQCPSMVGFQSLRLGVHANISIKASAV